MGLYIYKYFFTSCILYYIYIGTTHSRQLMFVVLSSVENKLETERRRDDVDINYNEDDKEGSWMLEGRWETQKTTSVLLCLVSAL